MTSRITERNLKNALESVDRQLLSSLPDDKHIIHDFSPSFEGKMKKLILRSKRMEKNLSSRYRRIIAITAIAIVLATVTLSITNVRAAISEFIIGVVALFSIIIFGFRYYKKEQLNKCVSNIHVEEVYAISQETIL